MSAKIPLKRQRVVRRLLKGPLHRFDAEKHPVYDHCLPSTVSELKSQFGLVIHATTLRLPGYAERGAYVALYRLDEMSIEAARQMLADLAEDAEESA